MAESLSTHVGLPGLAEVALVAFFTLLLFGTKLPEPLRAVGQAVTGFRNAVRGNGDDQNYDEPNCRRTRTVHDGTNRTS